MRCDNQACATAAMGLGRVEIHVARWMRLDHLLVESPRTTDRVLSLVPSPLRAAQHSDCAELAAPSLSVA